MPLYEFQCETCGYFEQWRSMSNATHPMPCPSCQQIAKRIFSPPVVMLSGSLPVRRENPEPQRVKRLSEPESAKPKYKSHADERPWMISH